MKLFATILCLLLLHRLFAQTCTAPGQNPATAFPVCGTSTFTQTTVPLCGGKSLPSPACSRDGVGDINPFWYKFTCFQSGTLGFLITPKNIDDDYDWELYDVTGRNPDDIYKDGSLVVACNWSGESGKTGASSAGNKRFVCAGYGQPLFSSMPSLIKGHNYLLLISHFTQSQSGYDLSFGGGTGVITDSTMPHLNYIETSCGGDVLRLNLNKHIKCNSIASDGSDFYITPYGTPVNNSIGINCSSQFDTDSLELRLSQFLTPGNYTLHIKRGSDGNTLLDYCDNAVPLTDSLDFRVLQKQPTPMDSLAPLSCAPQELKLVFRKPILCSSVAANGSDFTINGTYPVTITSASGNCTGTSGTTKEVTITLSQPLQQNGNFTLTLQKGTDGNTLIDECGEETPAGSNLSFFVKDTVNADFTYAIHYGCQKDTVDFAYAPKNGVNSWQWNLDESMQSTIQSPQAIYSVFNTKNINLIVGNGFCSDSLSTTVALENYLKADFIVDQDNCPSEPIPFTDKAVGKITSYNWTFGDGGTATTSSPTHTYAQPVQKTVYTIQYTVTDSFGCQSTSSKPITIYSSCYIAVPNAFTPNGDGKNDYLYPLNAVKAQQLEFKVYNRWGQIVFQTSNWKQGWDGTYRGQPLPSGVYIWMLRYIDGTTQKREERKGTAVLIR